MDGDIFHVRRSSARGDEPHSKLYTVDEALEFIGRGRLQWKVFWASCLCFMAFLAETIGISLIIPAAACELELDTLRKGTLTSITFLGIAVMSHLWGFLADVYGRRRALIASVVGSLIFSVVATLSPYYWMMVIFRFLAGMSLAGSTAINFAYMGEFYPIKIRSHAIMYMSSLAATTSIVMPLLAWGLSLLDYTLVVGGGYRISAWRFQLLLPVLPWIITFFLLRSLPESPKFLASTNNEKAALCVLQRIYEENTGKPGATLPIKRLDEFHDADDDHDRTTIRGFCTAIVHETSILFKPPYLGLILSCCFIQFGVLAIGTGVGLWFPELSNRLANSASAETDGMCQILNANRVPALTTDCVVTVNESMYISMLVLGVGYTLAYPILALFLNRVRVKFILVACLFISAGSGALLQVFSNDVAILLLFCAMIMGAGVSVSLGYAVVVELFPTHLRGMAISLGTLTGRLGPVVGVNVIGVMLELNCGVTIYGLATLALLCGITAWCLPTTNNSHHKS